MKKKQLLKLKNLKATKEMLQMAQEDIPQPKQKYGYVEYIYRYGIYIMAEVEEGILKVALFRTDHMTLNATDPMYTLFIDKGKNDFIGYNHLNRKWTSAVLDKYEFPYAIYRAGKYCSDSGTECTRNYLEADGEAFDILLLFQENVRRQNRLKKHRAITDQWDQVMGEVPKLPKKWEHWMKKTALTKNFIFFEYNRKGTTHGYCTWCEKEVPVENPKHNQEGVCGCCHHKILYKSARRGKKLVTEEDTAYLVQNCGNGFVVREFMIKLMVAISSYKKPMFQWYERRRFVYDCNLHKTEYYYGYDRTEDKYRWKQGRLNNRWGIGWLYYVECTSGCLYKKNFQSLHKGVLGKTGFPEYVKYNKDVDPIRYFEQLSAQPALEKVVKAGLKKMAEEMVNDKAVLPYRPSNELGKSLFIDRFRLNRLRVKNGGIGYLEWLKYEKERNSVITDPLIEWMIRQGIMPEDIKFIQDRMSVVQVKNYLERQSKESGEGVKDLLNIWEDYLIMAKRSQRDVTDPIIYRARYLVRRHNELARILGDTNIVLQAEEIENKYPMLPQILGELGKYEYSDEQYKIIAPRMTEDILLEGQKLQHCIHRNDRYFERMNNRESYILFLRKADDDTAAYYTLEVEPNGTVRQKRTLYNRQLEDIEKAESFLQRWQKQLQKKLLMEDYELAKRSKMLRIQEMEELRKNKVRLNGNFNGRLLADVLAEDLMEVAETGSLAA